MSFPARHPGTCVECGTRYHVGDPITNADDEPYYTDDGACYMRSDIAALLTCDAIHMLPGWENSRGATVEHTIATALGLPITYAGGAA